MRETVGTVSFDSGFQWIYLCVSVEDDVLLMTLYASAGGDIGELVQASHDPPESLSKEGWTFLSPSIRGRSR